MPDTYDTVVVGAGFAGSIVAERLASQLGHRVLVIDRRDHRTTINSSTDSTCRPTPKPTPSTPSAPSRSTTSATPRTSSSPRSGETFTRSSFEATGARSGSSTRRSCTPPCARPSPPAPTPTTATSRRLQGVPSAVYTAMFKAILDQPGIEVRTSTNFDDACDAVEYRHPVYTGPIDGYFDSCHGKLAYRSLEFELRHADTPDGGLVHTTDTVNYPGADVPQTRITEYRHLTGQLHHPTSMMHVEYRARRGPVLPDPQRRDPGALPPLRGAGRRAGRRDVRRSPGPP